MNRLTQGWQGGLARIAANGYTLIEILVALSVFAILATLTSSVLYHTLNSRERALAQLDEFNALQIAITLMQRDTAQTVARPVHRGQNTLHPAFTGHDNAFELTRGGLANPDGVELRSTLKRVAFFCEGGRLIRRSWASLDTPPAEVYQERILLEQLSQCQFAYLNASLQMVPNWGEAHSNPPPTLNGLPVAVQFNVAIKTLGNASFLLPLPRGLYAPP